MKFIRDKIPLIELKEMAGNIFGELIKAVVDIEKEIIVVGGELHSDEEALLLENGSKQENLWGINLYPDKKEKNWIEFDSMINLRPSVGNKSRGVDNLKTREKIIKIIGELIEK